MEWTDGRTDGQYNEEEVEVGQSRTDQEFIDLKSIGHARDCFSAE